MRNTSCVVPLQDISDNRCQLLKAHCARLCALACRYYGVSQPVCPPKHFSMHFLTTEQVSRGGSSVRRWMPRIQLSHK